MIAFILNVLWLIFGGLVTAFAWFIGGLILAITIIGIPWALAAWRIGLYTLWPFGREVVRLEPTDDRSQRAMRAAGTLMNIIWFIFAGWYIALSHLLVAIAEFVTIIGIPFALKDLELAKLALAPLNRQIVEKQR